MRKRLSAFCFGILIIATASPAAADCVAPLAACAMECDERTRPGRPERPECALSCISVYQRCERIEQIQTNTGGPVLNRERKNAPAR